MQLTSSTGTMIVNYFPIQNDSQFIYKTLQFLDVNAVSTKCISKRDFERECEERLALGYEVTDFNTEAVHVNPMNGAC